MQSSPNRTIEIIAEALKLNDGVLVRTAEFLNMSVAGLSARIKYGKGCEELQKVCDEARRAYYIKNLDLAETKHIQKIKEGDSRHILYHLDNHGKERGYGKGSETTHNQNFNWKIEIVHNVDDNKDVIDCSQKKLTDYAENSNSS